VFLGGLNIGVYDMQFYPSGNNVIFPGSWSDDSYAGCHGVQPLHINMYRYPGRVRSFHKRSLSPITCFLVRLDAEWG
jgi:hypothetical protein